MNQVSDMVRAHITVSGRVQGVFFRAVTREQALSLGLSGWVRNLADGRVELMAEGEKDRVDKLIAFVRQGPPMASVHGCEVEWLPYSGMLEGFRVTG
jgi:acylphosphatase